MKMCRGSTRSGSRISRPRRRPRSSRRHPGFAISDLRIEINTISLATKGKTKREVIRGPGAGRCSTAGSPRSSAAISCSCPALMAVEGGPSDRGGERRPAPAVLRYSRSRPRCVPSFVRPRRSAAPPARRSDNAVRIQQFHTDLADLPAAIEVWDETHGSRAAAAVPDEVAWLPIPGARVMVDLWVHVPGGR